MKILNCLLLAVSLVAAEYQMVFKTDDYVDGPIFHGNPKYTDDFCENDGYWVSKNKYLNKWSEMVCAEIGKVPVVVDQNNLNHVGFSLAMCNGEESTAWIGGYESYESCLIYQAESFLCGSIIDGLDICYESELPVICH